MSTEQLVTIEVMTMYRREKEVECVPFEWSFTIEVITIHGREVCVLNGHLRQ